MPAVINFTRPVFNVREDEGKARVGISVTTGVMSKPVTVRYVNIIIEIHTGEKDTAATSFLHFFWSRARAVAWLHLFELCLYCSCWLSLACPVSSRQPVSN
jgi:hypothetical protein